MAGREGSVAELDVALGEQRLSLRLDRGRVAGEIRHEVRGIVLSRRHVGLGEWIDALARSLADAAASNVRAREAASSAFWPDRLPTGADADAHAEADGRLPPLITAGSSERSLP